MIRLLPFQELIILVIQHCVLAYSWHLVLQFGEILTGDCLGQPFLCLVLHFLLILFIHIEFNEMLFIP